MSDDLDRLVKLRSGRDLDRLRQDIQLERAKKMAELAASGQRGGPEVRAAIHFAVRQLDTGIRATYKAFKEVYGDAGKATPEFLRQCAQQLAQGLKSTDLQLPVSIGVDVQLADAMRKDYARQVEDLKRQFIRDVEIEASTLEIRSKGSNERNAGGDYAFKNDVFISFASPDAQVAGDVDTVLKTRGLRTFFSPKQLQGGDPWDEMIREALMSSREICLIVSHNSLGREWVLTEWGAAWATRKRITPILLDCQIADIPQRLQARQCLTLSDLEIYAGQVLGRRE